MAKTAAKPKEDDKKTAAPAATPAAEGAAAAPADSTGSAAQASAPAAGDTPAAPAEPVRVPGVVVTGLQLCEALTFLAPDGSREQLGESLILELLEPAGGPAGLYAYHAECPEEGSILLTGEGVEVAEKAAPAAPVARDESGEQSPSARAATYVLAERLRQLDAEGHTPEADDALTDYQLPRAAACYVLAASGVARHKATLFWPFAQPMKVAEQRRRNLIKAAALILAELERLDRDAEQA